MPIQARTIAQQHRQLQLHGIDALANAVMVLAAASYTQVKILPKRALERVLLFHRILVLLRIHTPV